MGRREVVVVVIPYKGTTTTTTSSDGQKTWRKAIPVPPGSANPKNNTVTHEH
jgi:hypothetical protein